MSLQKGDKEKHERGFIMAVNGVQQADTKVTLKHVAKELTKAALLPGYGLYKIGYTIFGEDKEKAKAALHKSANAIKEFDKKHPAVKFFVGIGPMSEVGKLLLADRIINGKEDKVETDNK